MSQAELSVYFWLNFLNFKLAELSVAELFACRLRVLFKMFCIFEMKKEPIVSAQTAQSFDCILTNLNCCYRKFEKNVLVYKNEP